MPILSPVSVTMELDGISQSATEFALQFQEINPTTVASTAPQAISSLSGTATSDASSLGPLPEREDLILPSLQ